MIVFIYKYGRIFIKSNCYHKNNDKKKEINNEENKKTKFQNICGNFPAAHDQSAR